mgnify:CR=1 FL=1
MKNTNYSFVTTAIFLFVGLPILLAAQHSPLSVTYDQNRSGDYIFYAQNDSNTPRVVVINFSELRNLQASNSLPHATNVGANRRTRLLKLYKTYDKNTSNFRYRYKSFSGCINTEPKDVAYLLPFPEDVAGTMLKLSYAGNYINKATPKSWYNMMFQFDKAIPITAARKGTVITTRDENNSNAQGLLYTSKRNTVTVVHEDCTFARYSIFKDREIYVNEGDVVYPGDTLGMSAGDEFEMGNQIRLYIYYRNDASIAFDPAETTNVPTWISYKPKFLIEKNQIGFLQPKNLYTAIYTEKIITKEMGRRERKKWKKKNN